MILIEPIPHEIYSHNAKLSNKFVQLEAFLIELRKHTLPENLISTINQEIEQLNNTYAKGESKHKFLNASLQRIVKKVEKEARLVPEKYYTKLWLAIGMAAFGIPLGVIFGMSLKNMAFIGIGLPIGLGIGVAVGAQLDKKAKEENRQLAIELK